MSGLINKVKDTVKGGSSSGGGHGTTGQPSGVEKGVNSASNKGIDQLTDRAGMGDKYDDKINKVADGQINKQIPGGQQ